MPELLTDSIEIEAIDADAIAVVVLKDRKLTASGKRLDSIVQSQISRELEESGFLVKEQNWVCVYTAQEKKRRIFAVAVEMKDNRANSLRRAAHAAARAAAKLGLATLALAFDPENDAELQAVLEGANLGSYSFNTYKTQKEQIKPPLRKITALGKGPKNVAIRAQHFSDATLFVRDLANEPGNLLNPQTFPELAAELAAREGFAIRVFETAELESMGAGAFLSVGKGSPVGSRMIRLSYAPAVSHKHVALVGKGITFDSGGLSLKSETGMDHMKYDMSGAANVLSVVRATSRLKLPVQVTGLMMVTENMPDGAANRPGDVVRAMNGKTIEITNTDAEGRLALADGLVYAQSLKPDYLIDLATLTGAQIMSAGRLMASVMSNSEEFVQQLVEAGDQSGEKLWPSPLFEPYRELIKSDVADVKNSSGILEGPSIQAALFLSEFVEHPRWAHLDIAGPSWQTREWDLYQKNASGFGARCILTFLSNLS